LQELPSPARFGVIVCHDASGQFTPIYLYFT
jgi:hypothetical protein